MPKQELEFFDPEKERVWFHPDGYPDGVLQLTITEDAVKGDFTRLMKFPAGMPPTRRLEHDCWEEVYIIRGDLICDGEKYTAGMVAVRPPHMLHGPFSSEQGALLFEVNYGNQ